MTNPEDIVRVPVESLPVDENGMLNPAYVRERLGIPKEWNDTRFVLTYAASRGGNDPTFVQEVLRYGQLIANDGYGIVYGGMDFRELSNPRFGLMNAAAYHGKRILGISPLLFADFGGVANSGLDYRARNIVVHDFYPRKILMGVLSDLTVTLPGGYGTLEEAVEALIYAVRQRKKVHLLNYKGFWDPFISLMHTLDSAGMIDKRILSNVMTTSPNAVTAYEFTKDYFRTYEPREFKTDDRITPRSKHRHGLYDVLKENPSFITDHVSRFLSGNMNVLRLGFLTSSHISLDMDHSSLKYPGIMRAFIDQAEKIGRDAAHAGAVLALSGERSGLRQIIAEAALREGGSVIWIKREPNSSDPCKVNIAGRELTFTVVREADKGMLFDLISHAVGFLPGGIHTLDRAFEVVTREQTGFGRFNVIMGEPRPSPVKCPVIGYDICGLWSDVPRQIKKFLEFGYVEQKDAHLFQMLPTSENLVQELVRVAKTAVADHYDVLIELAKKEPRRPGEITPPATAARGPRSTL